MWALLVIYITVAAMWLTVCTAISILEKFEDKDARRAKALARAAIAAPVWPIVLFIYLVRTAFPEK
jgi:hypothetical protein